LKYARIAVVFISVALAVSTAIPLSVYSFNLFRSDEAAYTGDAIQASVFANYSSNSYQSAVFPDAYHVQSDRPLVYVADYEAYIPHVAVSFDEALSIAVNWLKRVGPPMINWTLQYFSNSTAPPSWTFHFVHTDFLAYVTVDSVSGLVIEYESKYLRDFDPAVLDLNESEGIAVKFLTQENITIPSTARYIKGQPYDCQRFYTMVFQEYSGPVEVEGSQVVVRASAFTRRVSYYQYAWLGISAVDFSGALNPSMVERNAVLQVGELQEHQSLTWQNPELALAQVVSSIQSSGGAWRLSWILQPEEGNGNYSAEVRADAFSGDVYGFRSTTTSFVAVPEHATLLSAELLLGIGIMSAALLGTVIVVVALKRQSFS
jgi:hypothetical protein